ncbi:MAG: hypothetical protein NTU58_02045 [Candidatus Nealsonbacteria bacterium]|nr:hypothetical protein [Candidatus Nealsonbacteria bacterium]
MGGLPKYTCPEFIEGLEPVFGKEFYKIKTKNDKIKIIIPISPKSFCLGYGSVNTPGIRLLVARVNNEPIKKRAKNKIILIFILFNSTTSTLRRNSGQVNSV